jgi:predicted NBD/HSP70 family sugar kinase
MAFRSDPTPTPADQTTVRRANLGVVMRHVAARGRDSRARIASETGLTRGTVSSLVAELVELGLLHETGEPAEPPRVGRPGRAVEVDRSVVGVGLEANVDYLAVSVEDVTGSVRYESRVHRENRGSDPGPVLDALSGMAEEAMVTCTAEGLRAVGVAVAVPGIVESASGTLRWAPNLGWSNMLVADELRSRLGVELPIHVENESNLAAVAEHWHGAAAGVDDFLFVFGEVGIGGGIFVGGELFRGSRGFGGELGHVTVVRDGCKCVCRSRGCVEAYAGIEAIARRAGVPIEGERSQSLATELARRAADGEADVLESIAVAGSHLGTAIASAVNLFDLDVIVLGGCFAILYPWLADAVAEVLARQPIATAWASTDIRSSTLAEAAAVRGAAAFSLRRVLEAPWVLAPREVEVVG